MKPNKIYCMDVFDFLDQLGSESVDLFMTSPPYWGLRDYGIEGQIGLENHPEDFIGKMVRLGRVIKQKIKPTGSFYLVLGDTYFGSWGNCSHKTNQHKYKKGRPPSSYPQKDKWLQPKQLMLIPSRVAIALQNDGWILRNDIIWHKSNPMPSSVKDRLNMTYEHLFHFVKSRQYYYDLNAIRVPCTGKQLTRVWRDTGKYKAVGPMDRNGFSQWERQGEVWTADPNGKNPGDLLEISTQSYKEAHFATYPEKLCEMPIKSSCPREICRKCGKARERMIKPTEEYAKKLNYRPYKDEIKLKEFGAYIRKKREEKGFSRNQIDELLGTNTAIAWWEGRNYLGEFKQQIPLPEYYLKLKKILELDNRYDKEILTYQKGNGWKQLAKDVLKEGNRKSGKSETASYKTTGWTKCDCNAGFEPGIVCDPFCGSGTTLLVAKQLGRNWIGNDLNPEYVKLAKRRVYGLEQFMEGSIA